MFERNFVLQTISDLSKEALGHRAILNFPKMTDSDLSRHWDAYQDAALQRWEMDQKKEDDAFERWKKDINRIMIETKRDRISAIRADMQMMGEPSDVQFYCHMRGIITYTDEVLAILNRKI